ncbi:FAS1 domain-containing protein [Patellaria atrata CBS 101060]|uniref:FAS1 domain-containing protein n=1 Tax=Patellaria atrata CBS 101060 TaxID=1346257 RepID=A0A9P4VSE0_9PEZI|nr:FAS1 domain-containing protein [Patellaria atrata CBS 101060]
MRVLHLVSLARIGVAFVIPDEEILRDVAIESHHQVNSVSEQVPCEGKISKDLQDAFHSVKQGSTDIIDDALSMASDANDATSKSVYEMGFDVDSWLQSSHEHMEVETDEQDHPPHHKPHHPPHHKPNMTVYELISKSKYTTKLAKLIDEFPDLVETLNGTAANYTVFAPTDAAFEKIPEHAPKPSKELLKAVLSYHVSPAFYPAGRVLWTYTIPTLYNESDLAEEPVPQRLSISFGLGGLKVNFYSKIMAVNIFGTNGVIHGVDHIIVPPPDTLTILSFFPGEFSTLELGLTKTGLLDTLNTTAHTGGTFFAPSNFAFKKLGPRINGFLFSKWGEKYLKGLLKYHIVHNQTLYSDAFYTVDTTEAEVTRPPYVHLDLPTLLEDHSLAIDLLRRGPFITIKINGFSTVTVHDGVAKDGVIQVVSNVLVPPKKLSGSSEPQFWTGEEMTVEEFKARLEPFVSDESFEL